MAIVDYSDGTPDITYDYTRTVWCTRWATSRHSGLVYDHEHFRRRIGCRLAWRLV